MNLKLRGQVAVITGPAKGMGSAITLAFAEEGAHVALLGRDVSAIEPVAEACRKLQVRAEIYPCDVTEEAATNETVQTIKTSFDDRIDILVNIAGGSGPIGKTGTETTADEFDDIVHLNMRGPFNMMRAVAPIMQARRYGKIVNIGGTFGMRGRAGRLAYSSSKWGLRGLTKSFALELGPDNINVNCVAPGMVDGPRFRTNFVPEMMSRLGLSEEE
ncbi:MAG: SDR family oxidoreductase, partial [Pseudomonadota bacterium]